MKVKCATIIVRDMAESVGFLAFCEDPNGAKIALIQHTGGTDAEH